MFLISPERPPGTRDPRPLRRLKNRGPTGGLPGMPHRRENPVTANARICAASPNGEEGGVEVAGTGRDPAFLCTHT